MHRFEKVRLYLNTINPTTKIRVVHPTAVMMSKLVIRGEQRDEVAEDLNKVLDISTDVTAFCWGNEMVLVAGIIPLWKSVGELWMFVGENFPKRFGQDPKTFLRAIRFWVNHMQEYQRVQTSVLKGFTDAEKFAKKAGFKEEGLMRKFGPNGKDYYRYARVT